MKVLTSLQIVYVRCTSVVSHTYDGTVFDDHAAWSMLVNPKAYSMLTVFASKENVKNS